MAKRILDELKIGRIAVVDRPCQEHARMVIMKRDDESQPVGKAKKLRDLKITELSLVDRPANVDAVVSIHKRDEPAPIKVSPAAQRDALAALERLIAKSKAATSAHTPSLDEVLSKSAPTPRNAALDELEALVAKRMDATGCSSCESWDHFAKADPDLYARAVGGN